MLVPRANELTEVDGCQARLETLLEGTEEIAKSDRLLRVAGDGLSPAGRECTGHVASGDPEHSRPAALSGLP